MRPTPRLLIAALVAAAALSTAPAALAVGDPMFGDQWALHPDQGGLDAAAAWRVTDGSGTVVALLDTGVDMQHADLQNVMWTNPGEIPGNGIDDDHDGYIDDVHGADIVNGDGDPTDDEGHGTHVAGIIAAQPNSIGVRGLAPGAKIMAVKVLDSRRSGNSRGVAEGLRYAIAHGANVINTSINGNDPDPVLEDAIKAADDAGILLVGSAGNDGRNIDVAPSYPASYPEPNILAVGASDERDALASFSNFGPKSVDLAAPGTDIVSTAKGGGYELRSGTSMAAPYVTATAALLHAARPDLGPEALRDAILAGVSRPQGLGAVLATGELDPAGALLQVVGADRMNTSTQPTVTLRAKVRRRAHRRARTLVTWSVAGNAAKVSRFRVSGPGGKTLARRGGSARGAWVNRRTGRVTVVATSASGAKIASVTLRLG